MTPPRIYVEFARVVLGLLAIFFAFYLGRSTAALWRGRTTLRRTCTWAFRTLAALLGVFWARRFDVPAILVLAGMAIAVAGGALHALRAREEEPLKLGLDEPHDDGARS